MTDIKQTISYQVMAQPAAQDITVTFADGTSFTARYAGSGSKLYTTHDGEKFDHITLTLLSPIDATVAARCGAVRDAWSARALANLARFPCMLPADHGNMHCDTDGDMW